MPGGGSTRWSYHFPNGEPLWLKTAAVFAFVNYFVWFPIWGWPGLFFSNRPSAQRSYPILAGHKTSVFVSPLVGNYIHWGGWISLAMFAVVFLASECYVFTGRASREVWRR